MVTENVERTRLIAEIEMTASEFVSGSEEQRRVRGRSMLPAFPGKTVEDMRRLARFARVLEAIHCALIDNVIVTKREIYYRDPELFGDQAVVDRIIEKIASGLMVSRSSLNVRAASKGLVIGDFALDRTGEERLVGGAGPGTLLIPHIESDDLVHVPRECTWILVVEKEATFTFLASAQIHCLPGLSPGIMITGKGYPDFATRAFLRRLSISHPPNSPAPRILGLVDGDPDGIGILSTYKYGSAASASAILTTLLSAPRLQWIGVSLQETVRNMYQADTGMSSNHNRYRSLIRLTARDRRKAVSVLRSNPCEEDGPEPEWRQQLQIMLMMNAKAEIQSLEDGQQGLVDWLSKHLINHVPRDAPKLATVRY